jgi:hypothetical protein
MDQTPDSATPSIIPPPIAAAQPSHDAPPDGVQGLFAILESVILAAGNPYPADAGSPHSPFTGPMTPASSPDITPSVTNTRAGAVAPPTTDEPVGMVLSDAPSQTGPRPREAGQAAPS